VVWGCIVSEALNQSDRYERKRQSRIRRTIVRDLLRTFAYFSLDVEAPMSSRWSEMFSNPWQAGITVYLIIGLVVVGIVSFRGMRLRPPPNSGPLWEQKDNTEYAVFVSLRRKDSSHWCRHRDRVVAIVVGAPLIEPIAYEKLSCPHLTNRSSQPLAVVMTRFNFMKQFSVFATLGAASGGSAPSR
jgi:hypothetical protein